MMRARPHELLLVRYVTSVRMNYLPANAALRVRCKSLSRLLLAGMP